MNYVEFDKSDKGDKINREKIFFVCNLINAILTYDINLMRPFEVKKLYDAKMILSRHAFKNYSE